MFSPVVVIIVCCQGNTPGLCGNVKYGKVLILCAYVHASHAECCLLPHPHSGRTSPFTSESC